VPEDVDPEEVFALLDDQYARALLVRLTDDAMTAQQLHETTEASLATVYRRSRPSASGLDPEGEGRQKTYRTK
jgi:hypothetical protein